MGECDSIGHLPNRAVGGDERQDSGGELVGWKGEADVADISVAPTVHDDVLPGRVGEAGQVGVGRKRPVGLAAQEKPLGPRDDQQAPIGEPVETEWK